MIGEKGFEKPSGENPEEDKKKRMIKRYCGCGTYIGEKEQEEGDLDVETTHLFCDECFAKVSLELEELKRKKYEEDEREHKRILKLVEEHKKEQDKSKENE